jgi:sugar lactone lactonase YvrE
VTRALFLTVAAGLVTAACERRPPLPDTVPQRVLNIGGFDVPEAARYDPSLDGWFVSNVAGGATAKDNNGFISRLDSAGTIVALKFIAGGVGDVTLHAPKGLAIVADTLWVSDVDAVRAFNRHTGVPVVSIDLSARGAVFLNDIAVGPDGAIYITDSGLRADSAGLHHTGPDRVYRIDARRVVSIALDDDTLQGPNGITWDPRGRRFVITSYAGTHVFGWNPGDPVPTVLATGRGGYDGVEALPDSSLLVASWADSTVWRLTPDGAFTAFIRGVNSPADIGVDVARQRLAVPLFLENRVEVWTLR